MSENYAGDEPAIKKKLTRCKVCRQYTCTCNDDYETIPVPVGIPQPVETVPVDIAQIKSAQSFIRTNLGYAERINAQIDKLNDERRQLNQKLNILQKEMDTLISRGKSIKQQNIDVDNQLPNEYKLLDSNGVLRINNPTADPNYVPPSTAPGY